MDNKSAIASTASSPAPDEKVVAGNSAGVLEGAVFDATIALSVFASSQSFLEIALSSEFRPEGGGPFRRPARKALAMQTNAFEK